MDPKDTTTDTLNASYGKFLDYRFAQVWTKLNGHATRFLQDTAGVSLTQWRVISLVGSRPDATASELTAASAIDKGLFSRKLKTLVQDGIIVTTTNQADSRIQHLNLTEKGRDLYLRLRPVMTLRQELLRETIGPEESDMLFGLLQRVEDVLDTWKWS